MVDVIINADLMSFDSRIDALVVVNVSARQKDVLDALSHGDVTNEELADRLGWSINCVTPRILELRNKDKVVCVGKKLNNNGIMVMVWSIKES